MTARGPKTSTTPTLHPLGSLIIAFAGRAEADLGFRLARLWPRWRDILGPRVAPYARPLGHRRGTLLAGVEDALAMQECLYDSQDILERVNAFLGQQYFDKVQFDLLQGKAPLDAAPGRAPSFWTPSPPGSGNLGGLHLDPETAVGRSYAAYVRAFGSRA